MSATPDIPRDPDHIRALCDEFSLWPPPEHYSDEGKAWLIVGQLQYLATETMRELWVARGVNVFRQARLAREHGIETSSPLTFAQMRRIIEAEKEEEKKRDD